MQDHPTHPVEAARPVRGLAAAPAIESAAYDLGSDQAQQGGLLEYWRILRRRKGTVILIALIGGVIGFLITLPQTPVYQARTSVEIVGMNDNFLNFKQASPVNESGATSETTDIQTQIKILQSESLLERVVTKLKRAAPQKAEKIAIPAWRQALNLGEPADLDTYTQSIRSAARTMKVRAAGQTRILEITADSADPNAAAAFANTLANEYIEQNLEARWQTTERTSAWLTRQLDDMRINLESSEARLQEYASRAGLIFTDEKTNVSEDKLRQVQAALTAAQTDRIDKQSRLEMANNSPPEALPDVLNDAGLREYQAKLTELRRQIAELTATYTPENAKVKRVQAQFATIEAALIRERAAILQRIHNEYDEALRREQLLKANYGSQAHLVSGEGERAIQYNILKREVDSNRTLYDAMLQQLKQSTIASALRASNIRVVDPAKVPRSPYKPRASQSAGIGLLAGLFLGIGFVVMRERADRSIQQPGDLNYYLGVPELGVIPAAEMDLRKHVAVSKEKAASILALNTAAADQRVEMITWQSKPSMVGEAFRATLISILFSGTNGSRPRVFVLSSPGSAEGKSTVVSNLGIAIAETGQRVLVIDADMRKPRQHNIFSRTNVSGLSDLLRSREALDDVALATFVRETDVPGLSVLTSGPATSGATNLLYGDRMAEILKRFRQKFDSVLIDTPPMLLIPDARVLGRLADKVILISRAGKTTRDAALAAYQRFQEDGSVVLGAILNDWNPKHAPNGYYGYYNTYYKSYSDYQVKEKAATDGHG